MSVVPAAMRRQVRERANGCCEYCCLPDIISSYPFHVDHIISQKHDGQTLLINLAWACYVCNIVEGTDIASYDKETGQLTPYFNPRTQSWNDHYRLDGVRIIGKTAVGRVTVRMLDLNNHEQIEARRYVIEAGLW